ncbi:MAG TPA: TetR/AcrR family transcriptional regulator [Alphaproteobacteria bacterium]|nr:TetR/AcrR family transcriptional regulator [Alphaproteobacteria bacterium]
MVQVKKPAVREAILGSAFALFSRHGYAGTTLAAIAADAGITTSNIYRYYGSKLEILYAVFGPWFSAHLDRLEERLKRLRSPRARLRAILLALWRDIPEADNGFYNNLMQALASTTPGEGYSRDLITRLESRFSEMIRATLPEARRHLVERNLLAHALFMGSDGFAINVKLNGPAPQVTEIVDLMCDLLIGDDGGAQAHQ